MAIVQPKPTRADRVQLVLEWVIGVVLGVAMAGVVGPIFLAMLIGKIWG